MTLEKESLEYHRRRPAGKLEIVPTKPCMTQRDLALAYTPGVAEPCRVIEKDPEEAYTLTARGNLVAVITNGTAVLGLGNIGALAGKPVMEGKSLLFKRFADIDAIDLEVDTLDPEELIRTVKLLEPSFGGINLEDIKAPECFLVEEELKRQMKIPVFHDDQHGTAIISGAALLNALELVGKRIGEVRVVFNGAGASAIATARFYVRLGVRLENVVMCDSTGVIYRGRAKGMNKFKEEFASETKARTLAEALDGADVLVGLSTGGAVTGDMIRKMTVNPVIFALANPDPEIGYAEALAARPDAIMATGRSDEPNQVNNVLGFPFIFRGALDSRATNINEEMKVAAARALAALAREPVPDSVVRAYGLTSLEFGREYIIPKPLDPRVMLAVAPAVARAAIETGVARVKLDMESYRDELDARLCTSREVMQIVFRKAEQARKRVVLAEGANDKMILAARQLDDEKLAHPILVGRVEDIRERAAAMRVPLDGIELVDPASSPRLGDYTKSLYETRCRKGVTMAEAAELALNRKYYAALMLNTGDADVMISGLEPHYPEALRPVLKVVGLAPECSCAVGVYLVTTRNRVLFFADTTVNIEPDADRLADIAIMTAQLVREFDIDPRIAFLSFSNFGSVRNERVEVVRRALDLVRQREPDLKADGEMQANVALSDAMLRGTYPFNRLGGEANVLIFPNLEAGNIACRLVQQVANAELVGPILLGLRKPVYVLQPGDDVKDIVNLASIGVVSAGKK